jgi:hypothetical protein
LRIVLGAALIGTTLPVAGVQAVTLAGRVGEASVSEPVDQIGAGTGPIMQPPTLRFIGGSTLTEATVPVSVDWPAALENPRPVARYELRMSTNLGVFLTIPLSTPLSRSVSLDLAPQQAYRFVVRAADDAGTVGAWARTGPLDLRLLHESDSAVTAGAAWPVDTASVFLRGVARRSVTGGSTLSVTVTGQRIAWIGARGPNRGRAEIWADGKLVTTVDTAASTLQPRRVLYQRGFAVAGTHKLEIRHLGEPVGSRIDVDGFLVVGAGLPDPVIVGAGDIASCDRTSDGATGALLDGVVGTVFTLGDNVYDNGTAAEFAGCYDPTWGRAKARTRPAPGNHDYGTKDATGYFGYFGTAAGPRGKGWYAYDLGRWRIYALNSNCALIGGCGEGSPQLAWLREDLASRPRDCVLATWHHARFSSGIHGDDPAVAPLFAALHAAGADVVLAGHDHNYERFAPQSPSAQANPVGVRQFIVGTGGNGLYPWGTIKPNSEFRSNSTYGVLKMTLRPGAYDWRFLSVPGGSNRDSGTAACH